MTTDNKGGQIHLGYVAGGYLSLLCGGYFDIIRGPIVPVVRDAMGLSYSEAGHLFISGNIAALLTTFSLHFLLRHFSERRLTLAACTLALFICGFSLTVDSYSSYLLLGFFIGMVISSLGAFCNILTLRGLADAVQAKYMSGLHVMYGLGALLCPLAAAFVFSQGFPWQSAFLIFSPVVLLTWVWVSRKVPEVDSANNPPSSGASSSGLVILVLVILGLYVGVEVTSSLWLVTYLEDVSGWTREEANLGLSLFFAALALSRFASFLWVRPETEKYLILASLVCPLLCFAVGFSVIPVALCFVGTLGPFFPVFFSRIKRALPDRWRSVAVFMVVAMQIHIMAGHALVGTLSDRYGLALGYVVPVLMLGFLMGLVGLYFKWEGRYDNPS